MNTIIQKGPHSNGYFYQAYQIGNYEIDCGLTIFAATRVRVRELSDDTGYFIEWCAGDKESDILRLINVAIELIEMGEITRAPSSNKIKPYYNDPSFCEFIKPYQKIYIEKIDKANFLIGLVNMLNEIK